MQDSVRRRKDTILRTAKLLQGDEYGRSGRPSTQVVPTSTLAAGQCWLTLVALANFFCVFCSLPSHRGSAILFKGWRVWEEADCSEMRCKRVTVQKHINVSWCQGMNRTSRHTANQHTAQLNHVFLFLFSLWSYFCFMKLPRDQRLVYKMLYLCGLQYNWYLAMYLIVIIMIILNFSGEILFGWILETWSYESFLLSFLFKCLLIKAGGECW